MHRKTIFNIKIDFEKSHDSYIYDKSRKDFFLDFFGLYATLPLGYNHPIFQTNEFKNEYLRVGNVKVPNNEIISDEAQEFLKEFTGHKDMADFKYFHFCCTGALALESAIKVAIDQKITANPMVISQKESFHGINSYGGFVTHPFFPASQRLDGFPNMGWFKIHNPKLIYRDDQIDQKATEQGFEQFMKEFDECLANYGVENIVALLIEPIQSTYGDNHFPKKFFNVCRELCDKHQICLIFDEIQTGFGGTGRMWYYQYLDIIPDIVAFGKKTQCTGIMVIESFNKLFQTPMRLEVTWDGALSDMVRCKYILRAYKKYQILNNVNQQGKLLAEGLKRIPGIKNVRNQGLLFCFDFENEEQRNDFVKKGVEKWFICNPTRDISVRLRPNLNVSEKEIQNALSIIQSIMSEKEVSVCL